MAAGTQEECIASDVDLDALDPEEIDQLVRFLHAYKHFVLISLLDSNQKKTI